MFNGTLKHLRIPGPRPYNYAACDLDNTKILL